MALSSSKGCSGEPRRFASGLVSSRLISRGLRQPGAIADDFCVEAEAAELIAKPLRHAVARLAPRRMGLARQMAEVALGMRGIGDTSKLGLKLAFLRHARRQKPREGI